MIAGNRAPSVQRPHDAAPRARAWARVLLSRGRRGWQPSAAVAAAAAAVAAAREAVVSAGVRVRGS